MTDQPKVALVTGASRGIGARIAERLAADGLFVVGTATTDAGAAAIAERLGGDGKGARLDIADEQSVAALVEGLANSPGLPSVLVNNAGVTRDNLLLRMSAADWQAVIDTNLTGLYRVTRPLLRSMIRARWGRIISLSSVVARMGNPGQANYVASKAAVEGFTRALALEVGSRGVTANTVAPGFIESDMTAALNEQQTTRMLERIPLGRVGSGQEVADAVAFLASDQAGYITGETLHVNGGLYLA
ncbi:MAG: 3-oxoacyl-ACP reductase FabG [Gammaproteobacteria bacterium]|nr:3-oxoacyl-ACP reductase FabG [Gammaproteobacteria bacterium]MYK83753.1 3-oxoacyl-ACP reductase FabG [Gammaproteobacteria bacterium]